MSSKVQRLTGTVRVAPFDWHGGGQPAGREYVIATPSAAADPAPAPAPDFEAIEREAFTKGYAQGERDGAAAAAVRGDAMLRRLAQTLQEVTALRSEMIQRTEHQVVQLALAIAKRITHREVSLDRDLLTAMARVALDRLGESVSATIRLHPDDYAAIVAVRGDEAQSGAVRLVPDKTVGRGGCLVHSDIGLIDVGVNAQLDELTRALLGDAPAVPQEQARVAR